MVRIADLLLVAGALVMSTELGATSPSGTVGLDLNLYPLADDALKGAVDTSGFDGYEDGSQDFNRRSRLLSYRGAYAGQGGNPGWQLALERQPDALFVDGFESGDASLWSATAPR